MSDEVQVSNSGYFKTMMFMGFMASDDLNYCFVCFELLCLPATNN